MIDFSLRENRQKFYQSSEWKMMRAYMLSKEPLCAHCLLRDRITIANQVHHVRDIKIAPELRLDPNNLECLCTSCHSKHTIEDHLGIDTKEPVNKLWKAQIQELKKPKP